MGLLMMLLRSGVLSRTRFKIQDPLFVTYIVLSTVKCVLKKHYNNGSICLFYIRIKKKRNRGKVKICSFLRAQHLKNRIKQTKIMF